jgi:hypothetical protein
MSTAVARKSTTTIARPLKVLIPLIQHDVEAGASAGMQYYADAGDKLIEAKDQVAFGSWGRWLKKNFDLSDHTARQYMRLARLRVEADAQNGRQASVLPASLKEMQGETDRRRERRKKEQPFRVALGEVETDLYATEKQTRDEEIQLHRDLAVELVDLGFKALATRLHPDRGGSKEAMARLNRVRQELKGFAGTRRFV